MTPTNLNNVKSSIMTVFGPKEDRIIWTPDEKVRVFKQYKKELKTGSSKRDALVRAYAVLDVKRRRDTFQVYTIIQTLESFAKQNPELFIEPKAQAIKQITYPPLKPKVSQPVQITPPQIVDVKGDLTKTELVELLALADKRADDRMMTMVELLSSEFAKELNKLEAKIASLQMSLQKTHLTKKPRILIIGGLDSQRPLIQAKVPWVHIETVSGEQLKSLSIKGGYDLIIQWTAFSSHSIENMLQDKYGANGYERLPTGSGLTTIVNTILTKYPK